MEAGGFILSHLFWSLIAWIWYRNILFRCIGNYSYSESKWIFLAILMITYYVGILAEIRNARNWISLCLNIIIGFGIYTVLAYILIFRTFIVACLSASVVISVVYAILVMCRKIKNRKNIRRIIRRRAAKTACVTQIAMGLGMAVIMLSFVINYIFDETNECQGQSH